jgi:hypothetical protein
MAVRKQILNRVREAESFLSEGKTENKMEFLRYLARWISWFQHERFVHLFVMLFFALFAIMMLFAFMFIKLISFLVLFLIFAVTTGFYIEHYYLLENKTQYLYELYDKIEKM